jgi:hypothetical protein
LPLKDVLSGYSPNVSMLRVSIIDMIHGNSDLEPIYTVGKFTVSQNDDGSVEFVLAICDCATKPFDHVTIRIERADN